MEWVNASNNIISNNDSRIEKQVTNAITSSLIKVKHDNNSSNC